MLWLRLRDLCDLCGKTLVDKKRASFLKHLVEFRGVHLSDRVKNDVVFKSEKSLRPNEAWLTDLAAFTIGIVQRNSERIPVRAARDLAENQIRAWKIGNDQSGTPLLAAAISARKRNDNDFAGYRFDHAASSSGEFQSRARTDSLSSAPLNLSSGASDASSASISSRVLINNLSHVKTISENGNRIPEKFKPRRTRRNTENGANGVERHGRVRAGLALVTRVEACERSRGDASDIDGQNREVEMGGST